MSKSGVFVERLGQTQGGAQGRFSAGDAIVIEGWNSGFRKAAFTGLMRAAGYSLADAIDLTSKVLDGGNVAVRLPQFGRREDALDALRNIGLKVH